MDVERLKHGGSVLDNEFFERQLEKIREIRLSERKFYQKITDIYTTAMDYDATATATKRFLRLFRISCTSQFMVKQLQSLLSAVLITKRIIWV